MLILVLSDGHAQPDASPGTPDTKNSESTEPIQHRPCSSIQEVLTWIDEQEYERIALPYPSNTINAFSLARHLKKVGGPPLVLFGELRADTKFWAERNGCLVADRLESAIGMET